MSEEHEKALRDLAKQAAQVADLIHQNGNSPAPHGGFQEQVLTDLRAAGSVDKGLRLIEDTLRHLVTMIGAHLGPKTR